MYNPVEYQRAYCAFKASILDLQQYFLTKKASRVPEWIQALREEYATKSLEELLPDIVFPIEDNARAIAEEIQRINAETWDSLLSLSRGQKSIVTDARTMPEASDAFTELTVKIVEGVRQKIDAEIDKQFLLGKREVQMRKNLEKVVLRYQDRTIPNKMKMLATHFNAKLTEVRMQEAGATHYIWHSRDDKRVRPSHAANDGKVFAWDNPPETGHPGEDYNCRCWAEPVELRLEISPLSNEINDPESIDGPPARYPWEKPAPILVIPFPTVELRQIKRRVVAGVAKVIKATGKIFNDPISKRPEGVPKDWVKMPSNKGGGYKYVKPGTKGNTDVRVQKGDPNRTNPLQKQDYVRWKKDGKWLDKYGKPSTDEVETHIPLDEFKFDKDIFK
jgi:SPP1 gp7 family putative phage head morphogenesis protein